MSLCLVCGSCLAAAKQVRGQVLDGDGNPVGYAAVTLDLTVGTGSQRTVTVFSDSDGHFAFEETLPAEVGALNLSARSVDHALSTSGARGQAVTAWVGETTANAYELRVVLQREPEQARTAPASAWMARLPDGPGRQKLMVECVNCHQFPTPEVRTFFSGLVAAEGAEAERLRDLALRAKIDDMSAIYADALTRGRAPGNAQAAPPTDGGRSFFHAADVDDITEFLNAGRAEMLKPPDAYDFGAPVAVTPRTVIREYEIPQPNAIREAIALGDSPQIWVADFLGDKLVRVDVATGAQKEFAVPSDRAIGPHTLVRGADESLWLSSVFNGFVGRLEPDTGAWSVWGLQARSGISPHDLTYDHRNELSADAQGRIWYSDISNNALGWFNPSTGAESSVSVSLKPGREPGDMSMYGIVMTSDRRQVCYTQLGGDFGCFDTESGQFVAQLEFPVGAGPRRMAITEDDVIFIPMFGAGRLIEYDARNHARIASHDLPDRNSGPYAATWDPRRRVVWIATSNADVIYRFDPATRSFGVIPLPRQKAYLRMIFVRPQEGHLVTTYANLPGPVDGPRMAVLVEPGD